MSDLKRKDNGEKNSGGRKGRQDTGGRVPGEGPKGSKAAVVWLLIFAAIGALMLFRGNPGFGFGGAAEVRELDQSQFEAMLRQKMIISAHLVNEGDNVTQIDGKMREALPAVPEAAEAAKPAGEGKNAAGKGENVKSAAPEVQYKTVKYRTRVIYSGEIAKLLQSTSVTVETNVESIWMGLLKMVPWVLVMLFVFFLISRQMRNAGRGAMEFGRSRARMVRPEDLNVKFSDIAGADEAKEEISEIVEYLKDPLKFQLVGGKIPKGCLLVGQPGTGKTLMAKAVACEAGVPFFAISGSDFVEMFVGVGASRVRDMFEQARKNLPCLIFIDEIDAVGRSRFSGMGGGHDEREQTLNAMLVEMDGLESRSGVIVLAATNRPDVLDPALLRPGRFDRQVVMDLPDIAGRRQILDVHVKKIKVDASVDLDVVARTTTGFSGADLANLCNEAALLAARNDREAVMAADMEEARDKVCYGRERRSRRVNERERRLTAFHESGHTLVAMCCEKATPVHKVTIIPRGQAYLGATFTMPKEDVYTKSRQEMLDEMAVLMGGRVAEEIFMGDITSGASQDINVATRTARMMTCIYGMTEMGPVKYEDYTVAPHMRTDAQPPDAHSPETLREIDMTIRKLVDDALNRARAVLTSRKDDLEKLALALLERETMDVHEVRELLGMPDPDAEKNAVPEMAETPEFTDAETLNGTAGAGV